MPAAFTPGVNNIGIPGPKGADGVDGASGGGPHTHPEYEHTHPYAASAHTHPEYVHTHPYASDTHNHDSVYALIHAHPYASDTHNHNATYSAIAHNHDAAYSATGHTHDTSHNHDATYALIHSHPYADVNHGSHPTADEKAALPGTSGLPSVTNKYVTDADTRNTNSRAPTQHAADGALHSFPGGTTNFLRADGAFAAPPGGGSHPDLAAHDTLGLATQAELDTHVAASDPHTVYVKENDAAWVDLTDGGASTAHSHAGGGSDTVRVVATDLANSTVTPAIVTDLTAASLVAGTYVFKVWVVFRAAATTTGIEIFCNFTAAASRFASTWYTLTTGGAAATGVADQATTLTAQMMEGKGQRAKDTASGPTQGVDTAAADQFAVVEGLFIATATGDFQMKFRSEVAASAVTIMTGTTLELRKVA